MRDKKKLIQQIQQILLYFFAVSFAALGFGMSVINDLGLQCFAVIFYCMAAIYLIMGWFWLK